VQDVSYELFAKPSGNRFYSSRVFVSFSPIGWAARIRLTSALPNCLPAIDRLASGRTDRRQAGRALIGPTREWICDFQLALDD
jgi:hypothetical protein